MSFLKLYEDFLQKKDTENNISDISLDDFNTNTHLGILSDENPLLSSKMFNQPSNLEHSYTRDNKNFRKEGYENNSDLLPSRFILVNTKCPSCTDDHEMTEYNCATIPNYDESAARDTVNYCNKIAKLIKTNNNEDDEDWHVRVDKQNWSNIQRNLFATVTCILDTDKIARLVNFGRQNEFIQHHVTADKSASRMRKAFASVSWDARLTLWLHSILMDSLPPNYMNIYLDILHALKYKIPLLLDKILFGRPVCVSQELLGSVMKKRCDIVVNSKPRQFIKDVIIIGIPSISRRGLTAQRTQKWYQYLSNICDIIRIALPNSYDQQINGNVDEMAEKIVFLTRKKIHDIRSVNPDKPIVLVGINDGSSMALQVARSENILAVVCMGFAYNTLKRYKDAPDDQILDIKIPVLFVIGENSSRSSTEEIESLREKMVSKSSLVVVGGADDILRISKSKCKMENVTQDMVDEMVLDEIYTYLVNIINDPPGHRSSTVLLNSNAINQKMFPLHMAEHGIYGNKTRKRKQDDTDDVIDKEVTPIKAKNVQIGRPRVRALPVISSASGRDSMKTIQTLKRSLIPLPTKLSSDGCNSNINARIQSLLTDKEQTCTKQINECPQKQNIKQITNFELVTKPTTVTDSRSMSNVVNCLPSSSVTATSVNTLAGTTLTKIKIIPSNHFMQLKPPLQSQSKIYTIKTNYNNPRGQLIALNSPNGQKTQFLTAVPVTQQKHSMLKNKTCSNPVQLSKTGSNIMGAQNSELDISNIIDLPILFADNEGNLTESVTSVATSEKHFNPAVLSSVVNHQEGGLTTSLLKADRNNSSGYLLEKRETDNDTFKSNKSNKVVFLNRRTMKPYSNIISRPNVAHQIPKYTTLVVTNPKSTATSTISKSTLQTETSFESSSTQKEFVQQPISQSDVISTNSLRKIHVVSSSSCITNVPIEKTYIKNIIVKPGNLKKIPQHLEPQLLQKNVTVRQLLNVTPTTTKLYNLNTSLISTPTVSKASEIATTNMQAVIQTSPKIITLNPKNPHSTTPHHNG